MMIEREDVIVVIGAVVAMLLQVVVAPNIVLFQAAPNFLLAYALAVAIVRPRQAGSALPFVLGLMSDLLGTGPVGGMALLFVVASFVASRAFMVLDNDTMFMPLTILVVCTFFVEVSYGIMLIVLGLPVSPLDAILYRALPCSLYDCAFGLIMYPIMARLLGGGAQDRGLRMPRLR